MLINAMPFGKRLISRLMVFGERLMIFCERLMSFGERLTMFCERLVSFGERLMFLERD